MADALTRERPLVATLGRSEIILIVTGILLCVALSAADTSIVTTAMPAIARELHGLEHLSWIVVAYLITSTAVTLVYGKVSDIYGRRRLILFAIVLFVGASLICALAQNVAELIAARALQGVGAGGLTVASQAMMGDLVSPRERARYQVYVVGTVAVAGAAGPPLGGFLVDHLSWPWVFWINLPIGIVAYLICRRFPALHVERTTKVSLDYAGFALLTAGVVALLLACSWSGDAASWISWPVLGMFAFTLVVLRAFAVRESRAAEPIFPPRLLANRVIRLGSLTMFLIQMLMYAAIVLIPVFLQLVLGIGAGSAGALLIPLLVGIAISSITVSQIMRRTGRYKIVLPIGFTLAAVGYILLSTMTPATEPKMALLYVLLLGMSLGACMPVINVAVLNAADPRDIGVATSTVSFSRGLGGAFGAAIFWSLLLTFLSENLKAAGVAQAKGLLFNGGGGALSTLATADRSAIFAALGTAFHLVFLTGAGIAVLALVLSHFIPEDPLKTSRPSERAIS